MKTTIDYRALPKSKARAKAIADVKAWFGAKKEKELRELFLAEAHSNRMTIAFRSILFALEFGGIQGFPARVYAAKIVAGSF